MAGHENLLTETPYLIAQSGPLQGERWTLQRDRFLIGRGRECDIVVPDRQISRQHARISRTADGSVARAAIGPMFRRRCPLPSRGMIALLPRYRQRTVR